MKKSLLGILVILLLLGQICVLYSLTTKPDQPTFLSPNINNVYVHSQEYAQTGELAVKRNIPLSETFDNLLFLRDGSTNGEEYVPQTFLGIFLITRILFQLSHNTFFLYSILAFLTLAILAIVVFPEKEYSKGVALALTLIFIPPVLDLFSEFPRTQTFSLLYFVIGLSVFVYYYSKKRKNEALAYIFIACFAASILFRYEYVLYIFPLILYHVFMQLLYKKIGKLILQGILGILILLPIVLLNQQIYGDPLTTGYSLTQNTIQETFNFEQNQLRIGIGPVTIVKLSPNVLWENIQLYLFNPWILLFLLGLISLIGSRLHWLSKIYILYVVLITVTLFGGRISWGFGEFVLNSSFLRYLIIPFLLSMYLLFTHLRISKRQLLYVVTAIVVLSTTAYIQEDSFFNEKTLSQQNMHLFREEVLLHTEENAVIFTRINDKAIVPYRNVIVVSLLQNNEETIEKDRIIWRYPANRKLFERAIRELGDQGIPVYIDTVTRRSSKDYDRAASQKGYTFVKISDNLHRLEKKTHAES